MAIPLEDALRFYSEMAPKFCDAAKAAMRLMIIEIYGITHEQIRGYLQDKE